MSFLFNCYCLSLLICNIWTANTFNVKHPYKNLRCFALFEKKSITDKVLRVNPQFFFGDDKRFSKEDVRDVYGNSNDDYENDDQVDYDPDLNPFILWLRKVYRFIMNLTLHYLIKHRHHHRQLYNSIFFLGLEEDPAPSKDRQRQSGKRSRPKKSAFFTKAEQMGVQILKSDVKPKDADRYRQQKQSSDVIKTLKEYIFDLEEELDIVDVTLSAAENSQDEAFINSVKYKDMKRRKSELLGKIENYKVELRSLQ